MNIINGSGTTNFRSEQVNGFDNYSDEPRFIRYRDIGLIESTSLIGTTLWVQMDFLQLSRLDRDNLNTVFNEQIGSVPITSINNEDEVNVGETFYTYTAPTNGFYIRESRINFRKPINMKSIEYYQTRLTFRFDTVTSAIKT